MTHKCPSWIPWFYICQSCLYYNLYRSELWTSRQRQRHQILSWVCCKKQCNDNRKSGSCFRTTAFSKCIHGYLLDNHAVSIYVLYPASWTYISVIFFLHLLIWLKIISRNHVPHAPGDVTDLQVKAPYKTHKCQTAGRNHLVFLHVANLPPPPAFMLDSALPSQHSLILFQFNLQKHREAPALMRNLQGKIH